MRSICLLRPNGTESFHINSTDTIRWSSTGITGNVRIELNRNYPTGTWDSIATVAYNASPYLWNVTAPITSTARIRITSVTNPTVGDTSDANFNIIPIEPTGFSYIGAYNNHTYFLSTGTAYWTDARTACFTAGGHLVAISSAAECDFINSMVSNAYWVGLSDEAQSGSWTWCSGEPTTYTRWNAGEPNLIGTEHYVYAYSTADNASRNWNNCVNTYQAMRYVLEKDTIYTIVRPNGGETFRIGNTEAIQWYSSSYSGNIRIDVNRNYPTGSWDSITTILSTMGNYNWSVTAPVSANARIRLVNAANPLYADTSNANFSIQPLPNLYQSITSESFAGTRPFRTDSTLLLIANRNNLAFRYQTITNATARFSFRVMDTDSLTNVNDSLRIWIRFTPDSTITFYDTLRLTFESPYNPIAIPISGLGIGTYIYPMTTALTFPNQIEPTRRDSLTLVLNVQGNRNLTGGTWVTIPAGLPFSSPALANVAVGLFDTIKVYFNPAAQGTYSGQIGLVSNAVNSDTVKVSVSGTSHYVPAPPGSLVVTAQGENAVLTWNRVDTSLGGVPLTVQRYLIYFRNDSNVAWQFLNATIGVNSTNYTHTYVVTHSRAMYYRVTAWLGNTDSFDRIIRTIPVGTSEAKVRRVLGIGW